ncbi:MAG: prephenate/arogenate dehydrogenase [Spirulina sp. SIO3F2]|nr:prephenate/arogenate dehydrogenase [Spirulina sp. SIO3F2]
MNRIGIVGLGLIGGSLGLDLRAQGYEVIGVSRRQSTCDRAVELGAVDHATVDLSALGTAEMLFLCTPINAIVPTLEQVLPYLRPEAIVTDVASVKTPIVAPATALWHQFVGGHPMAGTAEQGIEAAQRHLFDRAPYVLTPQPNTPTELVDIMTTLVQHLNSRLYICTPEAHDRAVARISHLPVMVSASLIASCTQEDGQTLELAQSLASSGFRDTSRVGGGNPELGVMMARYNRSALQAALQDYRAALDTVIEQIEQEDWAALAALLQQTQAARPPFVEEQ